MEQVWSFEMDDITVGCVSDAWLHNFESVCHIGFYEWIEDFGFEDTVCESEGRIIETVVDDDNGVLDVIANFDMECALYDDTDEDDDEEDEYDEYEEDSDDDSDD